ncbi:ABC transporter ATP-binding protein [Verminephrobacter aporrectodeae subsp. tuberculatae]|nr:ABC transporter ATP-binding protein [Verminephrobacter aporrectodeae subsp. tuberculatae]
METRVIDFARLPRSGGISSSYALVRGWPWQLGLACIGTAVSGVLSLLPCVVAWILLAQILGKQNLTVPGAWMVSALVLGWALRHMLSCGSKIIAHRLAFAAIAEIKDRLLDKLDRVRLTLFDQISPAQHGQLIGEQVDELEDAIAHLLPELTAAILVPLTLAAVLLWVDWRMGLACLLPYVIAIGCSVSAMSRGRSAGQNAMQAWNGLMRSLDTLLRHQLLLRTYNQADTAYTRIDGALTEFEHRSVAAVRPPLLLAVLFMVLGTSSLSVALLIGGILYASDDLSLACLAFFCVVSVGLGSLYSDVFSFFLRLGKLKAIWKRIFGLLDADELAWGQIPMVPESAGFDLRQVSRLRNERQVLADIDLRIPAGSSLALVGHSGAGKTSLAELLLRYDDPDQGDIELGGHPLSAYSQEALRDAMAYVSQRTELFALSVTDNIKLGRPDIGDDLVEAAAKRTLCHDFIIALPEGYATMLEPDGRNLSGGQRQRLALARAVVLDAPVLLLDEALAFSDIENEVQIQQAISELARGRTLIVIAHRLHTIRSLENIAVMQQGRIVEQGRHEDLIAAAGYYATLWQQLPLPAEEESA